ncbi:SGNH/GDSL hydrolase family protein [Tranquillimonas alkanivorans]|uniref:Lysophospholipase L1 n=1 Tax=Tranquillimonas alkanivorans TaxID=441119 RepID=A0A1I5MDA7_9RHOB|nr:SGNH/GDSL hydrolase family protein [Tranquillimonas alkanivorans]SFP07499.1 Lysophospholipase L1 [Tranquillimonas alkanivorans]
MPRVMCFGDSNTHGTPPLDVLGAPWQRMDAATRWPVVMAADLGPEWEVLEEGQPGRTTVHDDPIDGPHRNGLTVLPALLESHAPLDLVLVMLGTNDLKMRFGVPAQDVALALGRIGRTIRASGHAKAVMLVCPPLPRAQGALAAIYEGCEARGQGLPAMVERIADNDGFAFFDANVKVKVDPLDGVHFAPEAHVRLGRALAQVVRSTFGAT